MEKSKLSMFDSVQHHFCFTHNLISVFFFFIVEAFTATWSKYYCTYKKQQKQFTMLPYNQISGRTEQLPENLTLVQCTRRSSDFEKRFCFDLTFEQKPGITLTFQALSEEDRKVWVNAMDGKEPVNLIKNSIAGTIILILFIFFFFM